MKLIRPDVEMTHVLVSASVDPIVGKLFEKVLGPARALAMETLATMDLGTGSMSHEAARLQGAIRMIDELQRAMADTRRPSTFKPNVFHT